VNHPHNPVCEVCTRMERERIIKVLKTAKGTDCGCNDCKGVHNYIDLLIDLIQGENK